MLGFPDPSLEIRFRIFPPIYASHHMMQQQMQQQLYLTQLKTKQSNQK